MAFCSRILVRLRPRPLRYLPTQPRHASRSTRNFSVFQSATPTDQTKSDLHLDVIQPVYDKSLNWEDWFSPEEYGSAWEYQQHNNTASQDEETDPLVLRSEDYALSSKRRFTLEPLENDVSLDSSSRHLIQQLQAMYHNVPQTEPPVDLSQCRHVLGRLLESADTIAHSPDYKHKRQGDNGASLIRQRVLRAEAVLRTMELFWDWIPDVMTTQLEEDNHNHNTRLVRTELHPQHQKPLFEYPIPTYEMYVMVLRGLESLRFPKQYQKLYNSDIPWICQDVAVRMHHWHARKGILHLKKPTVEAWNQALSCWAHAHGARDHPDKAVHATQFLMDMKLRYHVTPDASSYGHVLRACGHHDRNERAKELGSKVAIKLWKQDLRDELQLQSFTPTAFTFVFLMRALGNLTAQDDSNNDKEAYLREAWEAACRAAVVNEHVLYELEQASTPLFQELLKEYRGKVDTRSIYKSVPTAYDKSYHRALVEFLPEDWKKGAREGTSERIQ